MYRLSIGIVIGGLISSLFLSNHYNNYIDTMNKLIYNIVIKTYVTACITENGEPNKCKYKAIEFAEGL